MLKSFAIKNFRCFSKLDVPTLGRINLFAGRNNAGKTALLESIFLHVGAHNPNVTIIVNVLREVMTLTPDSQQTWGWLFFNRKLDETIELSSVGVDGIRRVATLRLEEPSEKAASPAGTVDVTNTPIQQVLALLNQKDLVVSLSDSKGRKGAAKAAFRQNGIKIDTSELQLFPTSELVTSRNRGQQNDPERISQAIQEGSHDELVKTLRILEPRLKQLSVLVSAGQAMIHGDIGIGQSIPIQFMGEGLGRLLSLLLSMMTQRGGAVLIDEIETGIHHSAMGSVWSALLDASRKFNTQVFATTHSYECIRGAYETFSRIEPYEFQLNRLERIDDTVHLVSYDKQSLGAALTADLEIR